MRYLQLFCLTVRTLPGSLSLHCMSQYAWSNVSNRLKICLAIAPAWDTNDEVTRRLASLFTRDFLSCKAIKFVYCIFMKSKNFYFRWIDYRIVDRRGRVGPKRINVFHCQVNGPKPILVISFQLYLVGIRLPVRRYVKLSDFYSNISFLVISNTMDRW